eukprot:363067-Chlamydomonas_euryale.AAC.9
MTMRQAVGGSGGGVGLGSISDTGGGSGSCSFGRQHACSPFSSIFYCSRLTASAMYIYSVCLGAMHVAHAIPRDLHALPTLAHLALCVEGGQSR